MRIAYLASHYPAVSHTFVMREVLALRRLGVQVETFSIHRTPESQLLAEADREADRTTTAILPIRPGTLLATHARACACSPARYLSTLALALRLAPPGVRGHLWQLFYFAEAIVLWERANALGVRHFHAQFADVATDVALLVVHYGGAGWSWSLAVHGPVEFYNVKLYRLAEKVRRAMLVIAISHFGRSQLMTLTDPEGWDRIHTVRCGIEPARFQPREVTTDESSGHVLCVGRLVELKGQALLIDAVAELVRSGLDVRLTLVGDGPMRERLENRARERGIESRVSLLGAVGQDRIADVYATADVFCLPSMAEGVPVSLMEAMAMELPVVTTRIMGIPELVDDGKAGMLIAPGRQGELVDALRGLLTDSELRARLGRAGRVKVLAEFDAGRSAEHLRNIFASALEEPATSGTG